MSWRWDQGRMEYFQFDSIRKHAKFAVQNDLAHATHPELSSTTGLNYKPIREDYPPWRNYGRVFKQMLIVAQQGKKALPTKLAKLLAVDGQVTSDDYFHFFAQAFTDPAPIYQEWEPVASSRYPLLFALKFLLARAVIGETQTTFREIVGAYDGSGYNGDEGQAAFIDIAKKIWNSNDHRQSRESVQMLAQISYLSATSESVTVSLDPEDALEIFESLSPIGGTQADDPNQEILRLTDLFESSVAGLELDYSKTVLDQAVEAGFAEGNRVERTHVVLERNSAVRKAFFAANPTAKCDFCFRDTGFEYPWAERVLDIHHVLPLCSGNRSTEDGTDLADLVAVCPTCHRAVHRFYAKWLKEADRKDFADAQEARGIYSSAKESRKEV